MFVRFVILRRTERVMIKSRYGSSCNVPVILVHFQCNLDFLHSFSEKNTINTKFHEHLSSGSRVLPCEQTDRLTDITKPIVALSDVVNAPHIDDIQM